MSENTARGRFTHRLLHPSWLSLMCLTIVWICLSGGPTPGTILSGLIIAWLVEALAPLPNPERPSRTFRPIAAARLIITFLIDVVVAASTIAWMALRRHQPQGGVIRVHLAAESDTFLTATAGMISLIPGSIVVDANRLSGTIYLHVFDLRKPDSIKKARASALRQEELLLRAFGSTQDLKEAGYVPGSSPKLGKLVATTPRGTKK